MKKLATIIAVALLATLALSATWWLKIRDGRAQVEQLQARVAALEAAPKRAAIVEMPPVLVPAPAAKPAATTAKPAPTPAAKQPPAAAKPADSVATTAKQLISTEAGRGMMSAVLRQQYPDLAKALGISEAQANNVLDVLVRQQMDVGMDALGMMTGAPADPAAQQEMQRKVEEKTRANDAELSSLLGSKYADFQQYQATVAARQQVTQLQSSLGAANALSEDQSKAVLKSLAEVEGRMLAQERGRPAAKGSTPQEIVGNELKQLEDRNQQMLMAASPHLNFTQQEIYKNLLQQNVTMVKSLMQTMGSAPPQSGTR